MPIRRLAKKLLKGARALNEEAKHPGQPPPHKASENPFHKQPEAKAAPPAQPPAKAEEDDGDTPWYLDGTAPTDGWENTNAKDE
jgi:hypothetical protein